MKKDLLLFSSLLLIVLASCNSATKQNEPTTDTSKSVEAYDWALLPFEKTDSANPVMTPGVESFICPVRKSAVKWNEKDVFNPAVAVRNDTLFLLFRAQDSIGKPGGTSRIGLAWSTDGLHFTKRPEPVLYPDNDAYKKYEWEGGCEDPRMVEDSSGRYIMTYTSYDGKTARLMIATSTDLLHWTKYGAAFSDAYKGKYFNAWSKSGAIVSTYSKGKIVATRVNGKYLMYWGDKYIWLATSDDLIHWTPVEKAKAELQPYDSIYSDFNVSDLKIAVPTRQGKFDCNIVESGPPAMLTDKGILLLYNGRNIISDGDPSLAEGAYTSGQVLLDKNEPAKIISRMNEYFLKPEKPYEITGQVNQVCFIEALAQFKNKWWLYYGTADSKIAVAVKN
ncbi:MAG TPA: glycoside hydrolase family 130 protein [Panacibacter sp.]|nr:glycoside hydrolase family 130 protein [Panacibacter sp.]HNP43195.1 glycoside hydrolase family 130 protein [Panacibacter sp.]